MAYVDSLLGTNEKIVARHHQHWLVLAPSLGISLLLMAVISVGSMFANIAAPGIGIFGLLLNILPLITLVRRVLTWRSEEFMVTTRRIIQTRGVLTKQVFDSSLDKINDVMLTQSLFGRIFNFGDLEILTGSEIGINKLSHIGRPVAFKVSMMNAKEGMRDDAHP